MGAWVKLKSLMKSDKLNLDLDLDLEMDVSSDTLYLGISAQLSGGGGVGKGRGFVLLCDQVPTYMRPMNDFPF